MQTGTAETEDLGFDDGFEDLEPGPVAEPAAKAGAAEADKGKEDKGAAKDPEVESLREQLREERAATQFWHGQAKGAARPPATAKEPATPKKLSEDPVEAISSGDPERMRKVFKELGFVSEAEVEERVNAKASTVVTEQQLYNQYPDLRDTASTFYKATAREYQRLSSDPLMAKSPNLMVVAAELAAAKTGGGKPRETEQERNERVSRQAGDRGRRPAAGRAGAGEPEELSGAQKSLIQKFQMAGAPLSEEGYKKRATAGVRMGGAPTRRVSR